MTTLGNFSEPAILSIQNEHIIARLEIASTIFLLPGTAHYDNFGGVETCDTDLEARNKLRCDVWRENFCPDFCYLCNRILMSFAPLN